MLAKILSFLSFSIILLTNTLAQDTLILNEAQSNSYLDMDSYSLLYLNDGFFIRTDVKQTVLSKLSINGKDVDLAILDGKASIPADMVTPGLNFFKSSKSLDLYHVSVSPNETTYEIRKIPLWLSLVPPLVAILLALLLKEVIISLVIGIWSGAFIVSGMNFGSLKGICGSFYRVFDKYILEALKDSGHLSVIIFSFLIGAMVALISKNGGMMGVVKALSKYANSARSSQFITWLLGICIFFDDYANTLIVGNTMRSVTDKFKISREKLAYIVDSTAAPVSAIAFITTWIGAELGYIGDGIAKSGIEDFGTPYSVFLQSLKYSFYPILTLVFVLIIILTKKDFGTMLKAETRARTTGQVSSARNEDEDEPDMEDLSPVKGAPLKWQYAVLPILTVIGVTILGLLTTGFAGIHNEIQTAMDGFIPSSWSSVWRNMSFLFANENPGFFTKLGTLIGASDSYSALLWASSSGLVMALILTLSGRVMKLFDAMHWVMVGIKTMLPAIIILTLAWSLAIITDELHTADFISDALQGNIHPFLLPAIIFVLAAAIAFSTGSSWSTMAILYPIAIPTTYVVCQNAGIEPELAKEILLCSISTVLAASVMGDHISPISDTTILSSLASDCNHLDHVKTQVPYALLVGITSLIGLSIAIVLGGGWIICLIILAISVVLLYFIVNILGKRIPETGSIA